LEIGKVVKLGRLPVKFAIAGQYMPEHPSEFGQDWNVQVQVTPTGLPTNRCWNNTPGGSGARFELVGAAR
jgi:hypothetical protein